jgi:2-C-methyl-D-erythritol 4-phosphate cytidylyltransferase
VTAQYIALIPAAGIGSRMMADRAKQYLQLGEQYILSHTLAVFCQHPLISQVIVALHPEDRIFQTLPLAQHPKVHLVTGGNERVDSVLAGLQYINQTANQHVLVHDAARPCLQADDISRLITAYEKQQTPVIFAKPASDTIKYSDTSNIVTETLDRQYIWQAQTPQVSPVSLLHSAIEQSLAQGLTITDEASALEAQGHKVGLVVGPAYNIKVTHPEDLALAEFYLKQQGTI